MDIPTISKGDVVKMANGYTGQVVRVIPNGITHDRVMVQTKHDVRFTVPADTVVVLAKFFIC